MTENPTMHGDTCEDWRDWAAKQFSEAENNLVDVTWVSGAKNPESLVMFSGGSFELPHGKTD